MQTDQPGGMSGNPTGDDHGRYEFKTVKVIRGREANTAAKERSAGWELVSEDRGPLRTDLTFRRLTPRRQGRRQLLFLGAFLLVITLAIGIGVWSERGKSTNPADSSSERDTDEASAGTSSETDFGVDEDRNPKYGQTVQTEVRWTCQADPANCVPRIPLEVTVLEPVEFEPSDPTEATQAVNVYFTITIKNKSQEGEFDLGLVTEAGIGDPDYDWGPIYGWEPGDVVLDLDGNTISGGQSTLQPGQSITFREGWSVASLDNLAFKVRPAGLAGDTLVFTPR